ncbi:hypothetical protein A3J90_08740 [candidate division WOR-1 bacterium RIFOXYC2_FULL_37_10]|uniref:General secretion pathway GspH domain-containing protein n=1 Tax=candidate division WOR-1 bacterium RIFOXYB2_FULL_37_13 TaxID=1802579 RepID=A0A1F4SNJ9_UNCSA|nr:MAG: hypothetical protein A2246_05575 [candidate division WOR-1 bacterium RIFOXYA2_FULL_37_7]OGC22034.1 MAG: hypothetical protein A2310_07020 [candidate division WOR-1 bacterium RIFOXYB2_FULL_37_13]OGC33062.1 MAG: hypothetical protein A3J90_08740 [candidate division WOR-1 bacterium RIFOXYC2_FULL_37_10]
MKKGFSLIETVIVLSIIGILFAFISYQLSSFGDQARFKAVTRMIVSDLRLCQQNAITQKESCEIVFGTNNYKTDSKVKQLPPLITIQNPQTIRFASSGNPCPGYFGTIILTLKKQTAKIIISSFGRIRVE